MFVDQIQMLIFDHLILQRSFGNFYHNHYEAYLLLLHFEKPLFDKDFIHHFGKQSQDRYLGNEYMRHVVHIGGKSLFH